MRLWQYVKRNLYFMTSVVTVFLALVFAILMMFVFRLGEPVEETSVGFIYLGNIDVEQYENVLSTRVTQWQNTADYQITYQQHNYELDLTDFVFDVALTISSMRVNQNNMAFFQIPSTYQETLELELRAHFTDTVIDGFNYDAFISDLMREMRQLKNRKVYTLTAYLDASLSSTVLSQVTVQNITSSDVMKITGLLESFEIQKRQRFSILDAMKNIDFNNEQLSIIASAMQKMTRNTHFEGFIFEQYFDLPEWATLGMNTRILKVNQFDFTFYNRFYEDYVITIEQESPTSITFTLKGYPYRLSYQSYESSEIIVPFSSIYVTNANLVTDPEATMIETDTAYIYEKVVRSGVDGFVLFYYRNIGTGTSMQTIKLYDEQMLPVIEIIETYSVMKEGN